MSSTEKRPGVIYLQDHAQKVMQSSKIVVIGGGAVGVQMATDIKQLYPEKSVTLVHSRSTLMHKFHSELNEIILARCAELGIATRLGSRVKLPAVEGYANDGRIFDVELEDVSSVEADLAVRLDL
jgi:apoptosis-inducing factor 2